MSRERNNTSKALAITPDNTDHEVGYKKPPTRSQFKKGKSGNPKGRPKGSKKKTRPLHEERLKTIVLEEAYRNIPVQDKGKTTTIPLAQAVVRSLAVNAAKGNTRAQRLFTEMLAHTELSNKRQYDEFLETAIIFKQDWEREFDRCDKLGIPRPDILPHPDDVIINVRSGTVEIKGPMTREERAELEVWTKRKADHLEELEFMQSELDKAKTHKDKAFWQSEIEHTVKILAFIKQIVPD